ncbi:MAG: hypothetical protein HY921_08780 [Elusimicrobia bacterium]|nr:hypothetical protein [Elusimicrobiota bacterium]
MKMPSLYAIAALVSGTVLLPAMTMADKPYEQTIKDIENAITETGKKIKTKKQQAAVPQYRKHQEDAIPRINKRLELLNSAAFDIGKMLYKMDHDPGVYVEGERCHVWLATIQKIKPAIVSLEKQALSLALLAKDLNLLCWYTPSETSIQTITYEPQDPDTNMGNLGKRRPLPFTHDGIWGNWSKFYGTLGNAKVPSNIPLCSTKEESGTIRSSLDDINKRLRSVESAAGNFASSSYSSFVERSPFFPVKPCWK